MSNPTTLPWRPNPPRDLRRFPASASRACPSARYRDCPSPDNSAASWHLLAEIPVEESIVRYHALNRSRVGRAVTISLTSSHRSCYAVTESRSVKDAFGRGYSRMWSECGTRGRNDTIRSRAASGNYARPALRPVCEITLAGLGQEGAGNARLRSARFFEPGCSKLWDRASDQVPGSAYLELSCGVRSLQQEPRWNADRRACPLPNPPPQAGEGKETRARAAPPPVSSPACGGG